MKRKRACGYEKCPVELTLDLIGGKWKPMILLLLLAQGRRFNELRRLLPGVSQRTLTQQLRELELSGLLNRRIFAEVPARVEYSLTLLGRTLEPLLLELEKWGRTYVHHFPATVKEVTFKRKT